MGKICEKSGNGLERVWEKGKVRFWVFSWCFEMVKDLSIYRPRSGVTLKTIHERNEWPNRLANQLSTYNNQLLLPKLQGFDKEPLPFIKTLSQLIIDSNISYPMD